MAGGVLVREAFLEKIMSKLWHEEREGGKLQEEGQPKLKEQLVQKPWGRKNLVYLRAKRLSLSEQRRGTDMRI